MSVQTELFESKGSAKPTTSAAKVEEIVGAGFSVERFVDSFEELAEAPGGIAAFRRLVLDLAVRGRLVAERPTDEPQTIIHHEDERPETAHPPPFDVPSSWVWTSLERLCRDSFYGPRFGKNEYVSSGGVPTIRTTDMTDSGEIVLRDAPQVRVPPEKLGLYQVERGDLLITRTGSIGIMAVFDGDYVAIPSAYLIRFRFFKESVTPRFIYTFLKSPFGQERLGLGTTTTAQPNVNATSIRAIPVPVPPLEQQKRIVAKVDQLMALCDELEARQTTKRETGTRLTKSALEALTTAEGPEEFDAAWRRVVENFDVLIDRAEKVGKLRMAVRDLAVSGRLTPSSRNTYAPTWNTEGPFLMPASWRWAPFGELAERTDYGTSQKAHEVASGVRVLRMNNIQDGRLDLSSLKYVPETTEKLDELTLMDGDLLFNRTNSYELVGKMAVFRERGRFTFASYLIRVRVNHEVASPEYINMYFGSTVCRRTQIEPSITVQTNQANFNGTKLKEVLVPTPAKEEQERIVARVEQLMRVCDDLEARLLRAEDRAANLVEAAVRELVHDRSH